MDCLEIQNTQLTDLINESNIMDFLDAKLEKSSATTYQHSQKSPKQGSNKLIIPEFRFQFKDYKIGDSVQYDVQLIQSFKVFRRTITETYKFRTQYSKLQKLSEKLGNQGFPRKKWFGNKCINFIQQRKKELQAYLNKKAKEKSSQFQEFVLRIKEANFNMDYKKDFKLPN